MKRFANTALGETSVPLVPSEQTDLEDLFADASIEASARGDEAGIIESLGLSTQIFVPWLPSSSPEAVIDTAVHYARLGFRPIPHMAARRISSEEEARRILERLQAEAHVESVLLVGGDTDSSAGPYASAVELLHSGIIEQSGIRRIGIGGYPEGHPAIPKAVLAESIEIKARYAQENGLDVFIVSQFCFDGAAIVFWARRLRARGITAPIRIGIAGPTDLRKLLQLAIHCGVGDSLRLLRGRVGAIARMVATYDPDDVVNGMASELKRSPPLGPLALHIYAFGGILTAVEWLKKRRDVSR